MSTRNVNRRWCSVCTRPRADHGRPFGKNCVRSPLAEDKRQENLAQQKAAEQEAGKPSTEDIDSEVSSEDEEFVDVNNESVKGEKLLQKLQAEKDKLLAEQEKRAQNLKIKEQMLKEKEIKDQTETLQKELEALKARAANDAERMQAIQIQLESPASTPPTNKPTINQNVFVTGRNDDGLQQGKCTPPIAQLFPDPTARMASHQLSTATAATLDPGFLAYAQAMAAAARGEPDSAAVPHTVPPIRAMDSPNLIAAITNSAKRTSTVEQGKCLPENYIVKATENIKVDERITYYDFVHGLMRFLYTRHVEEGKPIQDYLKYYNSIAMYAKNYKWSQVYKLHLACINEMEQGLMKGWGAPLNHELVDMYCNGRTILPEREAAPDRPPRDKQRKSSYRREWEGSRSPVRGGSDTKKKDKTCDQYNRNESGCGFGKRCQFLHECEHCFKKGSYHQMPGMWCNRADGGAKNDKK